MNLTQENKALFSLLRAGLWECELDDLSPFPLTGAQWRFVYRMAVRQTIEGIACQGLSHLPENLLPDDALMAHWVAKADHIEQKNKRMNAAVVQLLQVMNGKNLHPVLLKGQGVATFYEQPLLRECGDIDLYFPSKEEYREAAELMRQSGCQLEKHADESLSYRWQGVDIEHHSRLFDLYNPFLKDYLSSLVQEHGFTHTPIDGMQVSIPSPLPNLLLQNAHLLKHIMGHGVGLRQFCDMARSYHALAGSYSPEALQTVYQRVGILKWSEQLHTFLAEHLGLPTEELPCEEIAATASPELMQIVMEGGNFGQYGDTKGEASQTKWQRKMRTFLSFWKHRSFSRACAPKEAFWTSIALIKGNLNLKN